VTREWWSICIFLMLSVQGTARAADEPDWSDTAVIDGHFALGVGAAFNRFDTNYQFTDKESGASIFVDGEGTLGLPRTNISPALYGMWRIGEKHGIGFHYFSSSREGASLEVDRDIGDLNITGLVTVFDRSRFYYANYAYTFVDNKTSQVNGILGLYGIDLKLGFEAEGDITINDVPVVGGFIKDEVNQLIPLPVIGIDFWVAVAPRWALGSKLALIGGSYKEYTALVVDASIRARFQMTDHVALMLGALYFNGDIDIDENDQRQEISYGYDGFVLGLDFNW